MTREEREERKGEKAGGERTEKVGAGEVVGEHQGPRRRAGLSRNRAASSLCGLLT